MGDSQGRALVEQLFPQKSELESRTDAQERLRKHAEQHVWIDDLTLKRQADAAQASKIDAAYTNVAPLNSKSMRTFESEFASAGRPTEAIIVSGPGGTAFGTQEVSRLKAGMSTHVATAAFGDGISSVDLAELKPLLQKVKSAGRRPLIFIQAHGEIKETGHAVELQKDAWHPTKEIFRLIASVMGDDPVDVFMTSCHGGGAVLSSHEYLARGSTFTALAPASKTVAGENIRELALALETNPLNFSQPNDLTFLYLVKALKSRRPPQVSIAKFGYANLDSNLTARIGKRFTSEELARIHSRLSTIMGSTEIQAIVSTIENAKDEWNIGGLEYGRSLAVCLAAI